MIIETEIIKIKSHVEKVEFCVFDPEIEEHLTIIRDHLEEILNHIQKQYK